MNNSRRLETQPMMGNRVYLTVDDDERLVGYLARMPGYLAGQYTIDRGPAYTWDHAVAVVQSYDREAVFAQICTLVNQLAWTRKPNHPARLEPGASPGSSDQIWLEVTPDYEIIVDWDWDTDSCIIAQELDTHSGEPTDGGQSWGIQSIEVLGLHNLNVHAVAHWLFHYWCAAVRSHQTNESTEV